MENKNINKIKKEIEVIEELSPCCNAPIVYKRNCSVCGEPVTDVKQMLIEIDKTTEKGT